MLNRGFYIRWLLISLCEHYGVNQAFRFVEGIGNIKRVFKYDVLSRKKNLVYIIRAQREMNNHLIYI